MANIEKFVAGSGVGLTWTDPGFTLTDFNSLAVGSVVVCPTAVTNGTALDITARFSAALTVGGTTVATSYLELYILPLQQDGSTYGDGTATGTTIPVKAYSVGICPVKVGVTSGSAVVAYWGNIILPPGNFKFALANQAIALNAAAAAAVKYQTYNFNLNG